MRSKKVIFVSHCILNQNARAIGREKAAGAIRELVELLSEAGVGIVQIPCPQMEFGNRAIGRKAREKNTLDTKKYRDSCKKLSSHILKQIESYLGKNYRVVGVLGVEFSPSCGVHQISNGSRHVPGKGIFFEEFDNEMRKKRFQVPVIGVNLNNMFSTVEKLQSLLECS
ncbi:MAG: CD3072 family TudS-related putative desulfidase [Candidatus Aenigmatarchaeota archaeon]